MSLVIDLDVSEPPPEALAPTAQINDTIVAFSGWEVSLAATPGSEILPTFPLGRIAAHDLVERSKNVSIPGRLLIGQAWFGQLLNTEVLPVPGALSAGPATAAIRFLSRVLDPRGRLIVYGNSAGGASALHMAQLLDTLSYVKWNPADGQYVFTTGPEDGEARWVPLGNLVVDLLITADAAAGPASALLSRRVAPIVARNINWYQLLPKPDQEFSTGGPNVKARLQQTTGIENEDLTGATDHYGIGFFTLDRALSEVARIRTS